MLFDLYNFWEILLIIVLFFVLFFFLFFSAATEEVSARIVQVVTAEAVAVLKGEQEKEAQHKDQPGPLPIGKTRWRMLRVSLHLQTSYIHILKRNPNKQFVFNSTVCIHVGHSRGWAMAPCDAVTLTASVLRSSLAVPFTVCPQEQLSTYLLSSAAVTRVGGGGFVWWTKQHWEPFMFSCWRGSFMSEETKIRWEAYKKNEILLVDGSYSRIQKMSFLTRHREE